MGSFLRLSSPSTTNVPTQTPKGLSPPLTKFKGVLLQHNGRWGAQIYAHHNRIWLGTFNSEREAAMAYDSAAMKLNRTSSRTSSSDDGSHHRNLPQSPESALFEPAFQALFSTEALLDMIKYRVYFSRFQYFLKTAMSCPATDLAFTRCSKRKRERKLFEKEMTPSDVGKLNRLVVPKKYARMYFPAVDTDEGEGVRFGDREGTKWEFRYCFWKSSQSYVFTKGWNKFVKEKGVRERDVVGFYWSEDEGVHGGYVIDLVRREGGGGGGGGGVDSGVEVEVVVIEDEDEEKKEEGEVVDSRKKMKLFGAWGCMTNIAWC